IDEKNKAEFVEGARCFMPEVKDSDLVPDTSGIRPKLKYLKGDAADFIIRHEAERGLPGFISLIGMESPGLTSSLAVAEQVDGLLKDLL
nr:hypothetical protein [Elusimicrobiales bacterium]